MTPQEEQTLRTFETRVRQLILAYRELLSKYERLGGELSLREQRIAALEAELERSRVEYQMLKTAKILTLTGEDQHEAKARVAKLIREVDKCISLLNV